MTNKIIITVFLVMAFIFGNNSFNKNIITVPAVVQVFPERINDWQGKDVKVEKSVYRMLDKDELLLRAYENTKTGEELSLAVVLTAKRDHIHDPEVCYKYQGISMLKEKEKFLSNNQSVKYVYGKKNNLDTDIVYWYSDRKSTYSNRLEFMKNIGMNMLLNKPVKGFALVVIINPQNNTKSESLINFADEVNMKLIKN